MPEDASTTLHVILADEVTSGQITVPLEAYAEFCIRLDLDLEILAARFAAFAAPNATLMRRGGV